MKRTFVGAILVSFLHLTAMPANKIHIGTSGWLYKHWVGRFYPLKSKPAEQFDFYCKHFDTVEVNNSFYKLPPPETFTNWYDRSPANFLYAVKANRFITHMRKLTQPEEPIIRLFTSVTPLKEKLGPILFQLPPKWKINVDRLKEFLDVLPPEVRYAFEFRNHSWYHEDIYQLLNKHNSAICIYELEQHLSPLKVTADFVYLRLHGPTQFKYAGSYNDETLKHWAEQCLEWRELKKDVYVYFDNDQDAFAVFNALRLKEFISKIW